MVAIAKTIPAAPVGAVVPPGTLYETASPVTVTVGNTPAIVYGAALAPGFAALYQIAIRVPDLWPMVTTPSSRRFPVRHHLPAFSSA